MSQSPLRIVRECAVISYDYWYRNGDAACEALVVEADKRATFVATERLGIKRLKVYRAWCLDCPPMEYPMYLLGPGAPQIWSYQDVFKHVSDLYDPRARYTVTIRDQDELDAADIRFYEARADQLAAVGKDAFLKQWASNVLEGAQKVLDSRGSS